MQQEQQQQAKNQAQLSTLKKAAELVMFNFLLDLQKDFEAKYKRTPEFLLIHPNDAGMLNRELREVFGTIKYSIPVIPSYLIGEHSPKFVVS
jgi:hypothetical protein